MSAVRYTRLPAPVPGARTRVLLDLTALARQAQSSAGWRTTPA